jgi:hypothetical protein
MREDLYVAPGWSGDTIGYVMTRHSRDGGYTFCRGTDSNAQDTYFGLAILKLLNSPFPNAERTVEWLKEFPCYSLHSHYYVAKALRLLGRKSNADLGRLVRGSEIVFEAFDFYVAVSSEFETAFMITELANIQDVKVDRKKAIRQLLRYRNKDGGFGVHAHSNLNSTYCAVASLCNLGYHVNSLERTAEYVKSCEKSSGGFAITPSSSPPHMEHVYYGVSTLHLLRARAKYPERIGRFVLMCQQSNGGFARSEIGIATLADTFYAVSVLV